MFHFFKQLFTPPTEETEMTDTFLIVGLGNPGREYKNNRHNIGFMAVDALAQAYQTSFGKVQNKALITDFRLDGKKVVLVKPQTYMNGSGEAVGPLAHFYKVEPSQLLVIYDELDLPFGTVRVREKGSSGGHNGMKSLIAHLGDTFPRLRLGIGRPPGKMSPPAYVLQDFGREEEPVVQELLDTAVKVAETFIKEGITLAMSRYNGTVKK